MITCKFEDEKEVHLRHAVSDGLIVEDNNVLLVRRAAHLLEGGKFCLPGGYMDRDEGIRNTVIREAREESGYDCVIDTFFAVLDSPNRGDDRQNVGMVFILKPVKKVSEADSESTEVTWFPLDALPPNEEIAFDHAEIIQAYKEHLKTPKQLPIFIS